MSENTPALEDMTVVQLRQFAADNNITLSSLSLPKATIIEELQSAAQQGTAAGAVQPNEASAEVAKLDGPGGMEAVISANPANLLEHPAVVEEPKCDRCTQPFEPDELTTVSIDRPANRVQRYCADCLEKVISAYGSGVALMET